MNNIDFLKLIYEFLTSTFKYNNKMQKDLVTTRITITIK